MGVGVGGERAITVVAVVACVPQQSVEADCQTPEKTVVSHTPLS